jgi:hypothetical protein
MGEKKLKKRVKALERRVQNLESSLGHWSHRAKRNPPLVWDKEKQSASRKP